MSWFISKNFLITFLFIPTQQNSLLCSSTELGKRALIRTGSHLAFCKSQTAALLPLLPVSHSVSPHPLSMGHFSGWVVGFRGSSLFGVFFFFSHWKVMSEKLSHLSRSVILINTLNDSEGGGLCPKVQWNPFVGEERILEMQILFSYGLKVIFTLHGDSQMHPWIMHCLLAFCCCNFILIVLCKDF